jgi:DNA invertase Pin-like site-specific DNA recombinase
MSKRGIIYCRVSSIEQVDGTSLESQERVCKEYAERLGIEVLEVFVDKGESAKTADRPQFLKAISFSSQKKNKVGYFIVYKLDRFARNQSDHVTVQAKLKQYGTQLRSVTEPIDDTPMGKMMEGVLSTFAEFDNNIRTERSTGGMKERLKQGVWQWAAPLGYKRLERAGIMVADENSHFIRLAFKEYAKGGYTYKALSAHLFKKGFRSKTDKPIQFQTIQKMLKNPLYAGRIIMPNWGIDVLGQHEPLISESLFAQCQSAGRKHKPFKQVLKNPNFPLRKLVVCDWCKQPLTGSFSTGRSGKRHAYYHHHKQDCSHALSIKKQELEDSFVSFLKEINPTLEFASAFKAVCMDIYQENNREAKKQNQTVAQDITKLLAKKKTIYNNFEDGIYSKEDFLERKKEVEDTIYTVQSQVILSDSTEEDFEEALDYCMQFVISTPQTWLRLAKQPEYRLRFQNFIIEGNLEYGSEKGFGTATLSPIYSVYQQYLAGDSSLVIPRRIELRFHG